MRTPLIMVTVMLSLGGIAAACQSESASQHVASMPSSYVGSVETPENCPYDDRRIRRSCSPFRPH
jgi:hypothetical protein